MKPNYIKGGVAILAGILCFIPAFLDFVASGGYGFSYDFYFKHISELPTGPAICVALALITMIVGILLVVYGALLFVPKIQAKLSGKMWMIFMCIVGAIALVTGAASMIEASPNIGAGAILFLVFGLLTIVAAIVVKFTVKGKKA